MPNWKKVITSGSDALLNTVTAASFTGSLQGSASWAATSSLINTSRVTTNFNYFPVFVDSANATPSGELLYTTSTGAGQITMNPGTGGITATSFTGSFTGSLFGTATTASYVNQLSQSVIVTGSITVNGPLYFAAAADGTNGLSFVRNGSNVWTWATSGIGNVMTISGNTTTLPQVTYTTNGLNVTPGGNQTTLGLGASVGAYPAAVIASFTSGSVTALSISGSGLIGTGSFSYSGNITATSFTGSHSGTSSYATGAGSASYVNTLTQNVLVTGSMTIGSGAFGTSENTLTLGPRDTTSEGGQLGLNAPGGTYTSASMLDNYQNRLRILRGTNASSDAEVAWWSMHSKQMALPAYNSVSAFAGTATALLAVDTSGNVITVATGSGGGGSGTVTNVATTGTVNGITLTGGPITTTGTITLGGSISGGLTSITSVTNNSGATGLTQIASGVSLNALSGITINPGSGATTIISGSIALPNISSTTTSNILYYDSSTKAVTYGAAGTATSASYSATASYLNPLNQAVQITGSLNIKGNELISGSLFVSASANAATIGQFVGSKDGYIEFSVRNVSASVSASSDIAVYSDTGTATANYIDMGINSSVYGGAPYDGIFLGRANDSYLFNDGGHLYIGNANNTTASGSLFLFAHPNGAQGNAGITITGSVVGINKTGSFNAPLDVVGNTIISGSLVIVNNATVNGTLTATASYAANADLLDGAHLGSLAVTGSTNFFKASQVITGSLSVTAAITANSLTGSLSGSLIGTSSWATNATTATSATSATNATNATNIGVTNTTTGTGPYYPVFVSATTGNNAALVDGTTYTYNATTNTLTVTSSYAAMALTASYALASAGGGGGGSGTVNSGVAGYVTYYPSTGTTVDDTSQLYWDNTNARLSVNAGTSPTYTLMVGTTGGGTGDIYAAGNVIAYSDQSVKENVTTITNALDKVSQMRGVTFTRNDQPDTERIHAGVIAQEMEKVFPEVVFENEDGTKAVAYANIVSVLIEAVKEQQAQIEDLRKQIEDLL